MASGGRPGCSRGRPVFFLRRKFFCRKQPSEGKTTGEGKSRIAHRPRVRCTVKKPCRSKNDRSLVDADFEIGTAELDHAGAVDPGSRPIPPAVVAGLLAVRWRICTFVPASGSDWVDGFLARRFGMVTVLGRVLDPFVDKILVCGTLIFLAAEPAFYRRPELLQPWMVVIILARELLVTALRSWVEEQGHDFSAQPAGKIENGHPEHCLRAAALLYLALLPAPASGEWLYGLVLFSVWAMVGVTIYSGVVYVFSVVAIWAKTGAIR